MSLPDKLKSPKKLQRSIYNQLQGFSKSLLYHNHIISDGSQSVDLSLSLRNINLVLTLPSTLLHIKPQADLITSLDLSYSHTDDNTLAEFCYRIPRLKHLQAVECGLEEVNETTPWPKGLRTINLSRNRLKMCPCGIANLFLLAALNLSGNRIENFDPTLLHLPYLEKLYLLKNPIANVPKHVCRLGVFELRQFFKIKPLSLSASLTSCYKHEWQRVPSGAFKVHPNLRQYMLKPQGPQPSLDSGYDSETSRRPSCSSSASLYDIESIDIGMDRNVWPPFTPSCLPQGYTCVHSSRTKHCQVYLPNDCSVNVTIEIVKDVSFHPLIEANNKFLITPVVQITPHGLVFNPDKPAIIVLNHCTKPNEYLRVTPLCSNTSHYQSPNWINLKTKCEVFHDCVMFETTHFSLFAAIGVLPYPSASVEIHQHEGGSLYLPEIPGLEIYIPPNSLPQHVNTTIDITATAYYNDHPYAIDHGERAIASTCLELKPHQIQFSSPVQISLPIPDYLAIKTNFPGAQLQLWHSSSTQDAPNNWECIENHVITVHDHEEGDGHIATFTTTHFSFFELLWTICKYPLAQLGLGASHFFSNLPNRARYISVRCQTFMSRPLCDLSFGLVVIAYKFGDPIVELSNYPWLVADSGSKRVFLKIGELCVNLTGCFDVREGFGEKLSHTQRLMEFNGEDFCLRFEFALRFDEGVCLPLPDGKILGKVHFTQWMGSNPVNHDYNIITPSKKKDTNGYLEPPSSPEVNYQSSTQNVYYTNADFTPPWSPDSDIHMECETSMCPPMPSSDTMTMTTTPAASSNIKRKRPRFVSSNDSESVKRQIFIRRDSISDKILMEISHKASYKYLELGLQLGLNYSTIQNRVGSSSDKGEHLKTFMMLQEWKSRAADEYTFSILAHALEQVGLTSLAREFCYTC